MAADRGEVARGVEQSGEECLAHFTNKRSKGGGAKEEEEGMRRRRGRRGDWGWCVLVCVTATAAAKW